MRLAILGATGKSGQALVDQALAAGHKVTALARTPAALPPRAGLVVVEGDARDAAALGKALHGCDAVISLLGNFNRKPNTDVSDATLRLCEVASAAGPKRIVVVTTIGVGDSFAPLKSRVFKLIIRFVAKEIWRDRERQEQVVRDSGLDWTIIRPGGLTDIPATGLPATGRWTLIGGGAVQPKKVSIARADLAAALLAATNDPALIGQTRCIFTEATA